MKVGVIRSLRTERKRLSSDLKKTTFMLFFVDRRRRAHIETVEKSICDFVRQIKMHL